MNDDVLGLPLRWRDAERAAGKLTPNCRRTLLLYTRFPLLLVDAIEALNGAVVDSRPLRVNEAEERRPHGGGVMLIGPHEEPSQLP